MNPVSATQLDIVPSEILKTPANQFHGLIPFLGNYLPIKIDWCTTNLSDEVQTEQKALGYFKILSCIIPTDVVYRLAINPLEIARVRICKDMVVGFPEKSGLSAKSSKALPTRSVTGVIRHIGKYEGPNVLLNGIGASLKTGLVRSAIFYPLYEYVNEYLKAHLTTQDKKLSFWDNMIKFSGPAFIATLTCRVLAMSLAYPFDYQANALQGATGRTTKLSKHNKKFYTGYGLALKRDLAMNLAFWPLYETMKPYIRNNYVSDPVLASSIASFFASVVGATISYPFDLVRTLKIVYEKEYAHESSLEIIKQIIRQKGQNRFYDGLPPRIFRNCIGNIIFFGLYQQMKELHNSFQGQEDDLQIYKYSIN